MIVLGGTDLSVFNFIEGVQAGSDIAYKGIFDMPARIGKTFHSWADRKGIQPYVNASEMFFGGRDIRLTGYILSTDLQDCLRKVHQLYDLLDTLEDLVSLVHDWNSHMVYISQAIPVEYIAEEGLKIELVFREPIVDLTGALPAEANPDNDFGIDGISWKDLGGVMLELWGDRASRPVTKPQQFTAYQHEGYQVTKPEAPVLSLRLFIELPDLASFKARIQSLYALLSSPGLRSLIVHNDALRSFFVKDGFTVEDMRFSTGSFSAVINMKLTQVGETAFDWSYLTDSLGNYITDSLNNKIIIRL